MTKGFPTDEQFTPDFVKARGVRLSVEIACDDEGASTDFMDRPGFFYWNDNDAVFLVDFNDGFSPALRDTLRMALAMIQSTGLSLTGKAVHWRDADKTWHTMSALQAIVLLMMPQAITPVAA